MRNFSDKLKIIYLTFVILFAVGVLGYLLDTWGVINLENYVPYLSREAPVVPDSEDDPFQLDRERIEKEQARIEEEKLRLEEDRVKLEELRGKLKQTEEDIARRESSLTEAKKQLEEQRVAGVERERMIRDMADRVYAMPPRDAVEIMGGFSNTDLVDVLLQIEKNATEAGRQSIVPYLLTLMPRERASLVGTLMMDEQARRLPRDELN